MHTAVLKPLLRVLPRPRVPPSDLNLCPFTRIHPLRFNSGYSGAHVSSCLLTNKIGSGIIGALVKSEERKDYGEKKMSSWLIRLYRNLSGMQAFIEYINFNKSKTLFFIVYYFSQNHSLVPTSSLWSCARPCDQVILLKYRHVQLSELTTKACFLTRLSQRCQ